MMLPFIANLGYIWKIIDEFHIKEQRVWEKITDSFSSIGWYKNVC